MKKEAFLVSKLTEVHDMEILNNAIYEWSCHDMAFKDALFSEIKKEKSFKNILDNEPQKFIKYFKNITTEILLYDLLINSVEICKNNFIDDEVTNYLNKCNFGEETTESLRWFSKTLRNNLVHHQDASIEIERKNDKYKFSFPKNKGKDDKNQTISLTETEFVRLLYFTTLFWQRESGNGIGSFEDDVMYIGGEGFSKATNTNAEYYISSLVLKGYDFLKNVVENFNKNNLEENNVLQFCVQLTSSRCFVRNAVVLEILTHLLKNPNLTYSEIKSNTDEGSKLNILQQHLAMVGTKNIICLETITKSVLGSLDEEFFKGAEIPQIAGISMETIKSFRNSFIHNRYLYSDKENKFVLFKKENYKSKKLEIYGEILSKDLKVLVSEICHAQYNRESVKTYAKENINLKP